MTQASPFSHARKNTFGFSRLLLLTVIILPVCIWGLVTAVWVYRYSSKKGQLSTEEIFNDSIYLFHAKTFSPGEETDPRLIQRVCYDALLRAHQGQYATSLGLSIDPEEIKKSAQKALENRKVNLHSNGPLSAQGEQRVALEKQLKMTEAELTGALFRKLVTITDFHLKSESSLKKTQLRRLPISFSSGTEIEITEQEIKDFYLLHKTDLYTIQEVAELESLYFDIEDMIPLGPLPNDQEMESYYDQHLKAFYHPTTRLFEVRVQPGSPQKIRARSTMTLMNAERKNFSEEVAQQLFALPLGKTSSPIWNKEKACYETFRPLLETPGYQASFQRAKSKIFTILVEERKNLQYQNLKKSLNEPECRKKNWENGKQLLEALKAKGLPKTVAWQPAGKCEKPLSTTMPSQKFIKNLFEEANLANAPTEKLCQIFHGEETIHKGKKSYYLLVATHYTPAKQQALETVSEAIKTQLQQEQSLQKQKMILKEWIEGETDIEKLAHHTGDHYQSKGWELSSVIETPSLQADQPEKLTIYFPENDPLLLIHNTQPKEWVVLQVVQRTQSALSAPESEAEQKLWLQNLIYNYSQHATPQLVWTTLYPLTEHLEMNPKEKIDQLFQEVLSQNYRSPVRT